MTGPGSVNWAGRTFGQLSPDEKRQAASQAGRQLSAELTAAAPAIERIMDAAAIAPVTIRDIMAEASADWCYWMRQGPIGEQLAAEDPRTPLEALDSGAITQADFWSLVTNVSRCGCWSCDGQCAGSAADSSCGLVEPDESGHPICASCRELTDVIDLERNGIQVASRVLGFDELAIRLEPDVWDYRRHNLFLTPAGARALAARLLAAADETEGGF